MRNLISLLSLPIILLSLNTLASGEANLSALTLNHQLVTYITNPNIAYLLLLIGIYGIFFELANPGLILPGITGVIALLLALYAFQLIPINYLGVMLIFFGMGFMIAEIYVASFGVIGILGVIAFIIGSIFLFNSNDPTYHIAWPLILTMSIISFTFIFMILSLAIKSHKRKIVTGREGLIGSDGVVISVMNEQIVVRVMGEIWNAKSSVMLNAGDKIKVIRVQDLVLFVELVEKNNQESSGE